MGAAADGAGDRARAQAAHTRRARLHDGPRMIHLHLKPPRLGRLALPVDLTRVETWTSDNSARLEYPSRSGAASWTGAWWNAGCTTVCGRFICI
jgi:hypothetical protein